MDGNPWQVDSLQDFLYMKCPECTFDTQEEESFEHHALENHPLSIVFFGETFLKEENFELDKRYLEDYKDPLITNVETQVKSEITPSENLALTPIFPKLTNLKEDLIDDKSEFKLKKHVELIHDDKRSFGCSECDLKFKFKRNLKRHFSLVHTGKEFVDEWKNLKYKKKIKQEPNEECEANNKEMYKCECCDYTSTRKSCIVKHMVLRHKELDPYKCSKCDYYSEEKRQMIRHVKEVHNTDKIQCPKCEIKIAPENLKKHIKRIHDRIYPFLCNTCGFKAVTNSVLKNHVAVVHEGKRHVCFICGLGVTSPTNLKKHISAVHEGKKPYKCELCEYHCSEQSGIKEHIRKVHEKIKPHKCDICQKHFGTKAMLKKHTSAVHEGKKDFKCSLCDKKFSVQGSLTIHKKSVHEGIKSHMCSQCGASFSEGATLRRHIKGVHEKETPYICKICNHGFKQNGNLKYHLATVHKRIEDI